MLPARRFNGQLGLTDFFNDFFENRSTEKIGTTVPAINVMENDKEYKIAVAAPGITANRGIAKVASRNRHAVVNEVRPVLPPAETPAPDSTKVVTVEVPSIAPAQVATASEIMILS